MRCEAAQSQPTASAPLLCCHLPNMTAVSLLLTAKRTPEKKEKENNAAPSKQIKPNRMAQRTLSHRRRQVDVRSRWYGFICGMHDD